MSRKSLALGAVVAATLAATLATPASAITDGAIDSTGAHPNVGVVVMYDAEGPLWRCTATLIADDVLVTAAHCTEAPATHAIVSFDTYIREDFAPYLPPSEGDDAWNPATEGGSYMDPDTGHTWYAGQTHTSPKYSGFTDIKNWNDYGVVTLDGPVPGIEPAELAPVGYLDTVKQPTLNKTLFTTVGYGTTVVKPDEGPRKPVASGANIIRQIAQEPGQKLSPQILQVNGNGNDNRGTGGTCFGDSGGPTFLDGYLVAVTSYGYTLNCRYLDGLQRVDIPIAQDWISSFLD
ncbi:trypsin-like serine protease [Demequina sp.]|uniref:trypsin-like serine protease n=1 Tax=Demequina sp. TaxID=2050685 RepID=UPI0025EBB806|nr:trypsin-like serine protease [Demequina sp.]